MTELISSYLHWEDLARILKPGDLIEFKRLNSSLNSGAGVYKHWAVYIGRRAGDGERMVIHYSNEEVEGAAQGWGIEISGTVEVKWETLQRVANGCPCRKNNGWDDVDDPFGRQEIVERAMSKLGERGYNFVTNNCEHFSNNCRYGKKRSGQVNDTATLAGVIAGGIVVGGLLYGAAYLAGWLDEETPEQKRERERNERNERQSSNRMLQQ